MKTPKEKITHLVADICTVVYPAMLAGLYGVAWWKCVATGFLVAMTLNSSRRRNDTL